MFWAAGIRANSARFSLDHVADQRLERRMVDRAIDQDVELLEEIFGRELAAGHQVEKVVAVGRVGLGDRSSRQDVELKTEAHVVPALHVKPIGRSLDPRVGIAVTPAIVPERRFDLDALVAKDTFEVGLVRLAHPARLADECGETDGLLAVDQLGKLAHHGAGHRHPEPPLCTPARRSGFSLT